MSDFKIVALPVKVPDNDYCWNGKVPCEHFDNTGSHGTCALNIGWPEIEKKTGGYKKPTECMRLVNHAK